jgi:hypothetical protein
MPWISTTRCRTRIRTLSCKQDDLCSRNKKRQRKRGLFFVIARVPASCGAGCRKKDPSFFGQPGGSAVLSMQDADARSLHGSGISCSAFPAAALLWGRFLFDPLKGMHTPSRRSRTARGWGEADPKQFGSAFPKAPATREHSLRIACAKEGKTDHLAGLHVRATASESAHGYAEGCLSSDQHCGMPARQ